MFKIIIVKKNGKEIQANLNFRTACKYAVLYMQEGMEVFIKEMKDEFDYFD